jgi:hypothetical protein
MGNDKKKGALQGSIIGPLFFLPYINDLPFKVKSVSKPTLFTDDTSIIYTNPNFTDFKSGIDTLFTSLNV